MRTLLTTFLGILLATGNLFAQSPTIHSSNIQFTRVKCNEFDLKWTSGNGDFRIVVVSPEMPNSFKPTYNSFYVADDTVRNLGAGKYQVVYSGAGNSTTVYGLQNKVRYYFSIFEADSSGSATTYLTTSSYAKADTVTQSVMVDFRVNDGFQCLSGNSFEFTNVSKSYNGDPLTFNWDFGDGNSSKLTNPKYAYSKGGMFRVRLTANSDGCTNSIERIDTVVVPFITKFELDTTINSNDSVQCLNGNEFFFHSLSYPPPIPYGSGADRTNYLYRASDGQKREVPNASFSFKKEGTYRIKLITIRKIDKDTLGCMDSTSIFVKVEGIRPPDSLLRLPVLTRYDGGDSTFKFEYKGTKDIIWNFGKGDTTSAHKATRYFSQVGDYPFELNTTKYKCNYAFKDTVHILKSPQFYLGNDRTVGIKDAISLQAPSGHFKYEWSTGDTTRVIMVKASDLGVGKHEIWGRAYIEGINNFSDTILLIVQDTSASVQELSKQISIYPNPSKGKITIENIPDAANAMIWVTDIYGRKIVQEFEISHNSIVTNIKREPGIYILIIELKGEQTPIRVIIK